MCASLVAAKIAPKGGAIGVEGITFALHLLCWPLERGNVLVMSSREKISQYVAVDECSLMAANI